MNARTLLPLLLVVTAACGDKATIDVVMGVDPNQPVEVRIDPDPQGVDPTQCDQGYTYQGFGGLRLEVGRDEDKVGFDRDRVKPLSALRGEYARVLGATPALLDSLSNTFGAVPPRWFIEPQANAVSLFSSLRVAFVGCLDLTDTAEFDLAPAEANAKDKCAQFARRFWSRAATADELDACALLVTTQTAQEPVARRKWAYTCASVLASASFLTY